MHPCVVITTLATITYLLKRKGLNPFRRIRVSLRMSIFWPLQVGRSAFLLFLSLDRVEVLKFPEWLSEPHEESKMSWASITYQKNTTSDSQMLSLCLFDDNHSFRCLPKHVQMANVCIN